MAGMIFARENGLALKLAPKHRGLLIREGLDEPPGILDEPWSRLRISAKLGGGRAERHWTRYWPLVTGFILLDAKTTGGKLNPLATVLIDLPSDIDAVYGDALLLGHDPTAKGVCSIPDDAIIAATNAYLELSSPRAQSSID
jgi:hypothetical protein